MSRNVGSAIVSWLLCVVPVLGLAPRAVASPVDTTNAPLAVIDPASTSGGAHVASTPAPVEPPFEPGEHVRFTLEYLGMDVGEFFAEVSEQEWGGKRVWPIATRGASEGLIRAVHSIDEQYTSLFDPTERRAIGSVRSMRQNDFWQREETRFEGKRIWIHTRKQGEQYEQWKDVTEGAHDIVSAIYFLRTEPLTVGSTHEIPVFTTRQNWTLKVRVTGKERVDTPMGPTEAFVLKLRTQFGGKLATEREITLWLTDDARRLPAKAEASFLFGTIKAQAVEYRRGMQASR